MIRKSLFVLLIVGVFLFFLTPVNTLADSINPVNTVEQTQGQDEKEVVIYFFWGDGCPHCAKAKPVLRDLASRNPTIKLYEFEIYNSQSNQELFAKFGEAYGFTPRYVPTILIGDRMWEGYSDEASQQITDEVDRCLVEGCVDNGADLIAGKGFLPFGVDPEMNPTLEPTLQATEEPMPTEQADENTTKLPLFGNVDFSKMGLFLSTALIAFVDGFNPCSLWVLSMLLAITLHTGSRKKVLVIGLIFVTVTAAIYALFIAGLFTILKVVSFVGWIQVVVALVALFFGLINIKDYFFYKEGVSFTISEDKKPGIFQRMRKVMDAGDSWWGLIGGTIILAAGVSFVEFSCTAGFPVLWTNLVAAQQVTAITFILLLLLYMLIYQLDELGIFLVAVFTLKSSKMEEKHGRILKLIGGVLMLTLAIVMLINPALMSDIGKSLVIFAIAFGATVVILILHRAILPRLGIHFGTEFSGRAKTKTRQRTRH
ncbi:MAG TPA: hypothetical protein PKK59_07245 [Anaerolineaceae bacterium]|nr:hypothetical protein [Anaerolineaceae bacterium]